MRRSSAIVLTAVAMSVLAPAGASAETAEDPSAAAAPPSAPAAPTASVGGVDCINGGAYANMSNAGGQPATFIISRDNAVVDTVVLESSSVGASRLVPVAEDATAMISITAEGMGTVAASVARDCEVATPAAPAPAPAPAAPAADGATAVAGVAAGPEGSGTPSSSTAPAADGGTAADGTPASDSFASAPLEGGGSTATPDGELPFTGAPPTVWAAVAGMALLALGGALHVRAARRGRAWGEPDPLYW